MNVKKKLLWKFCGKEFLEKESKVFACVFCCCCFNLIFYYSFIFGCTGSLLLCTDFLQLWITGAALQLWCGSFYIAVASLVTEHRLQGFQAQFWCTGSVVCQHVESSWTRDQTCVLCISKCFLIHWATREVLFYFVLGEFNSGLIQNQSLVFSMLKQQSFLGLFSYY